MPLLTAGGLQGGTAGWCWCCPNSPADRGRVSRGQWLMADLTNVNMLGGISSWIFYIDLFFTLRKHGWVTEDDWSGEKDCDILRLSRLKLRYITMWHDAHKGTRGPCFFLMCAFELTLKCTQITTIYHNCCKSFTHYQSVLREVCTK